MLHLQEKQIFDRCQEEGLKLGKNMVACYYFDNAVEKGDGYKIHVANKNDKHLEHLEHLHLQWKERFDLKHSNTQCQETAKGGKSQGGGGCGLRPL